ncbi:MAG: flagellar brake protein [Lachnospiraceae bacterium]|nr:flagellar brake protein [Lachnospiraceae bacterium]MBQ5430189.1 flagellar brake protein [Lachnospiraceae bacterium]MCR4732378.1 flagellar brake domain-containing protein [Lachnospiraceae bacterium]MEE3355813.1 flagellar brake domain-containing protein [Candidatus Weimeria sp.]
MKPEQLKPGAKVMITPFQEIPKKDEPGQDKVRYQTILHDLKDDGTIVLELPIVERKLITLPVEGRYEFVFSISSNGFLMAVGKVIKRYRKGSFYLMDVELLSSLEKFQRREYFRLECFLPALCICLGEKDLPIEDITDYEEYARQTMDQGHPVGHGTITNISGGGAHFVSSLDLRETTYILLRVNFSDEKEEDVSDGESQLLCEVLEKVHEPDMRHYAYRLKFIFRNDKFREKIIRFVFDEQRKIRRKEQGD